MTEQELLDCISILMKDLRLSWGKNYSKRILVLKNLLNELKDKYPEHIKEANKGLKVCENQLVPEEDKDGRFFRRCCVFYKDEDDFTLTINVKRFIRTHLQSPESFIDGEYD